MSTLYSYNGAEPKFTEMLIFPDGSTRTGEFSKEDLKKAGYTGPYTIPEHDTNFQRIEWDFSNLKYVILDYPDSFYLEKVRGYRNHELRETDQYMIEDYPKLPEEKSEYKSYRDWLRNIPQNIESGELNLPKTADDFEELFSFKESFFQKNNSTTTT